MLGGLLTPRVRIAALLLPALWACEQKAILETGLTGIELTVTFEPGLNLDQLALSGSLEDGSTAFEPGYVPPQPKALTSGSESVTILLPEAIGGQTVLLRVDGLSAASIAASERSPVGLQAARLVPLTIALGLPAVCGDDIVREGIEDCDDGNSDSGDGCSATCATEAGFTCDANGTDCAIRCGDGVIGGDEACDDSDNDNGDGCAYDCTVEAEYSCSDEPSVCVSTAIVGVMPPGNDACGGASPLASGVKKAGETLVAANNSASGSCAGGGTLDVFYDFTLGQRSVVNLLVDNTAMGTSVSLLQGACGSLSEVDCAATGGTGENARLVDLPGGDYLVLVDGPIDGSASTFDITYTAQSVPDNNSCVAPAPLTLDVTAADETLVTATDESAGSCAGGGAGEVVYELTLPSDARVRATATRKTGTFNPVLYIRSACDSGASEPATGCADSSGDASEVLDIDLLPSGTYSLFVDSTGGTPGTFDLLVEQLPVPPANDRCSGTALSAGVTVSGTTVAARDDTAGGCGSGSTEVFYNLTLAAPRRLVADLTNTTVQHALYVQGTCGNDATEQGCVATGATSETLDVLSLAAGTYTIVVETEEAGGGTFNIVYNVFDPVPNDTCLLATALTPGVPRAGDSSVGANDDQTATCAGGGTTPDILYSYTLGQARRVNLSVNSDYNAAVAVRSADCASGTEETCLTGSGAHDIEFRTQAAGTYYVLVDGIGNTSGTLPNVSLTTSQPPPAGDYCPEAVTLSTGTTGGQALSSGYGNDTVSDGAGACGGGGAGRERVYVFTVSGGNKDASLETQADFEHRLYVRKTSCTAGTELGCAASVTAAQETASLNIPNLTPGDYWVFVDADPEATGTFSVTLNLTAPPPNDTCAMAIALGDGVTRAGETLDGAIDDTATCVAGSQRDVFYNFTIPGAGAPKAVLATLASVTNTSLSLRSDCTTEIACVDATGTGETLDIGYLAAGTYYLVVEGVSGAAGAFNIGYSTSDPRPQNDQCSGAVTLADGTPRTGDTLVNGFDDDSSACGGASNADVVYDFTIPAGPNQRAQVNLSNAAGFDPVVYLQQASCGGSEVACADSVGGAAETLDIPSLAPGTYYAWVDAAGAGSGTFDIELQLLTEIPPPGNDVCNGTSALSDGTEAGPFSTRGGADDYSLSCLAFDSRDTTHRFNLGADAAVLVTLTPQSPHWELAAALHPINDCNNPGGALSCAADWHPIRYINRPNLTVGDYDIVVDGYNGATGEYLIKYETAAVDVSFGYWVIETFGNTYTQLTVPAGATSLAVPTGDPAGDGWSEILNLPFDFTFYGTTYQQDDPMYLSDDMYLSFSGYPGGAETYEDDCLDGTPPEEMIAPFWDDGYSYDANADILYKVEGTAPGRWLTIEWQNFRIFTQGWVLYAGVYHQVVLYETTNDIEFRYGPRSDTIFDKGCRTQSAGCSASIGIETGTDGGGDAENNAVHCGADVRNVANIEDGQVIYFVYPR